MNESLRIDSPLRGRAMHEVYSFDLRERVIEAVEGVRRGARRLKFRGEREFGGKVAAALARKQERWAEAAWRKHFSDWKSLRSRYSI